MANSIVSASPSSTRKRPARRRPTMFTKWQVERLEAEFKTDQYPDITARERLATSLQLHEDRVQVWFQNRRARQRRAALKTISTTSTATSGIVNTRKRKSQCDLEGSENTSPPSKKLAVISPSMSVDFLSRSSRSSDSASSPDTTPRDTHRCATSPLMSVDFLSRSSRPPSPSTSRLTARPGISPALTPRSSFPLPSFYAWSGHPHIFMFPH